MSPRTTTTAAPLTEAQRFQELRMRAATAGHTVTRGFGDSPYVASCWGQSRRFETIAQLSIFVDLVTGVIDARVAETKS